MRVCLARGRVVQNGIGEVCSCSHVGRGRSLMDQCISLGKEEEGVRRGDIWRRNSPWLYTRDISSLADAAHYHRFYHTRHIWHLQVSFPLTTDEGSRSEIKQQKSTIVRLFHMREFSRESMVPKYTVLSRSEIKQQKSVWLIYKMLDFFKIYRLSFQIQYLKVWS